ncbi:SDR family oxidoreductase [Paenibacillus sp. CGMCC 1.16610]|uniref:SDR family NAD(P)-dependent oxidoreductase n=1 Tax=Paenibacillus anseongense TaxID=2682845 RepID=A0ABW9UHX7_9BACL|nr:MULTISPECIES: SDR family oxidoreductase [Paenibacillus]MBA2939422.1 SDR family oxidoreductase [Paenibacillus sp. CGMCC 1.16610]MVQ39086.1 SDR family NAD(P)-dependent oxidoreductase [Paenibacillus anseongense]
MNIVITGANRGLGYELTLAAVQRGHKVIAGNRSPQEDVNLLELVSRFPGQVKPVQLDVCDEASIVRLAETLRADKQTVDAVINNAGILLGRGVALEELPIEDVVRSFEVNLFGPMMLIKHMLPLMEEGSSRAILNISSEAGSMSNAYGGDFPYAISKTAINMFSKQLKRYVKNRGIRVYAIHPGWIKTDMGGEKAPGDPVESANGIIDILEMKKEIDSESFFVNYKGEPMPM